MTQTGFKAIIVAPAYRLNVFGFVASKELQDEAVKSGETAGNLGFWDQRTALEWTAKNIGYFGGDASNITVAGKELIISWLELLFSLAFLHAMVLADKILYLDQATRPDLTVRSTSWHTSSTSYQTRSSVIRQAIMWSNSPGVQPRTYSQHQKQFDEVLTALDISRSISAQVRNSQNYELHLAVKLADILDKLEISEFRATTDNAFRKQGPHGEHRFRRLWKADESTWHQTHERRVQR